MRVSFWHYFHPRCWPAWICYVLMKLLNYLPLRWQYTLGRGVGRLLKNIIVSRRHVVRQNIKYCFPNLDSVQREKLLRQHYDDVGISVFETTFAWNASNKRFKRVIQYEAKGLEHLETARKTGQGILLLSGHFLPMELTGRIFHEYGDFKVVARLHQNIAFEQVISRGRLRYINGIIDRNNMKTMIHYLRSGGILWYAPDQDFGPKRSVFANFMGVPTAALKATSRLAALGNAVIVPCCFARLPNTVGHLYGEIYPPLEPSSVGNEVADAQLYNDYMGNFIRRFPSQYLWLHKRFKTRPKGEPPFY